MNPPAFPADQNDPNQVQAFVRAILAWAVPVNARFNMVRGQMTAGDLSAYNSAMGTQVASWNQANNLLMGGQVAGAYTLAIDAWSNMLACQTIVQRYP